MIQDSCKSFFLYLALALGFKNIYDRQDLAFDKKEIHTQKVLILERNLG